MPIAAVLGETLVTLDDLDKVAKNRAIVRSLRKGDRAPRSLTFRLRPQVEIGPNELERASEANDPTKPFQGIGTGKPLTVTIESIYVGEYPDAMPWVPLISGGDVLVTSAHKAFEEFDAAPRAVHLLEPNAKRRSYLKATAVKQGSQLVYYSPAVADMSILFTVELSVDRDINKELGDSFGKAVTAAGALPVFATAAPFLIAAGTAIPIAVKAANLLARPNVFYREDVEINFDRPGPSLAQPGALVLYPNGDEGPFVGRYKLGRDFRLKDIKTGKAYAGTLPYVVISLDGTERPNLKTWSAHAASAALVERFHQPDALMTQALEVAGEGLALFNDVSFQRKAADALERVKKATGANKVREQALYDAYLKNIQNKAIKASVDAGGKK